MMESIASESKLVKDTNQFVKERYQRETPVHLVYHDYAHIVEVTKAAVKIAKGCGLNDDEIEIVKIAAMLHDIGYLDGCKDHEKKSADIAEFFLRNYQVSDTFIQQVRGCILATSMPQQPANLLEQVLCDADLVHLTTDEYPDKARMLRKEWECQSGTTYTEEEWQQKNIKFFNAHQFFTEYAKDNFEALKQQNLNTLLKAATEKKKKKKNTIS